MYLSKRKRIILLKEEIFELEKQLQKMYLQNLKQSFSRKIKFFTCTLKYTPMVLKKETKQTLAFYFSKECEQIKKENPLLYTKLLRSKLDNKKELYKKLTNSKKI